MIFIKIWLILIEFSVIIGIFVSVIRAIRRARLRRRVDAVKRYSLAYLTLSEKRDDILRQEESLPREDTLYVTRKSLQAFRVYIPSRDAQKYVLEHWNVAYLSDIIKKVERNRELRSEFESFKSSLDTHGSDMDWEDCKSEIRMSYKKYCEIESGLISRLNVDCIKTRWTLSVCVSYVSPGGRSNHRNSWSYDATQLLSFAQSAFSERASRTSERNKMTAKLRYQVLREDGFRCQICGKSASDGVALEVDHIKPVSKGGLTVRENLRTLCHDCNQGKKDRYFVGELN